MNESYDHRATHPAAIDARAPLWFGTEVEGRYTGHPAAFVAAELSLDDLTSLVAFFHNAKTLLLKPVVFFTETFTAWEWAAKAVLPHASIVCAGCYAGELPQMLELRKRFPFHRIELLVRLFNLPQLLELRPSDQVCVGVPYDLRTFLVSDGYRTVPDNYRDDKAG